MRARAAGGLVLGLWLGVGLCVGLAGCGHSVAPTEGYDDPSAIPLPQDLQVFVFSRQADLVWTAPDEDFRVIDGWNIYRAQGEPVPADGDYTRQNATIYNASRSYIDQDLEDGVTYWYRLTSVSAAAIESPPTLAVSARADFVAPAPPTDVSAVAGPTNVVVSWVPPGDSDVSHFNVFRTPPVPPLIFFDIPATATSFTDVLAISPGDTLHYWVTAVDFTFNESAPSETVTVVVPAAGSFISMEDP